MVLDYEYWKSPAVRWLLSMSRANDPETFMRQKAKKLLLTTGQDTPPFSPQRVASLRKISRIEWAEIRNISELVPIQGGFLIRINGRVPVFGWDENRTEGRPSYKFRNFSIAHEIGHTFFYDTTLQTPRRPFNDAGSLAEERLCDIFATELLMPEEKFHDDAKRILGKQEHLVNGVIELSSLYKVSTQAVAIRLFEIKVLDRSRHIIVKWNWMLNPHKPQNSKRKLRVEWGEPAAFPYIPKYASAQVNSIFERASLSNDVVSEKSRIRIGDLKGSYPVEAVAIRSDANRGHASENISRPRPVLSIIWLNASLA
jgi:Zn-dependent peptidase ImmA (M78 family)